MEIIKAKRFTHFIGIDVSKDKLDCVVMSGRKILMHQEISNDKVAIRKFVKELKLLPKYISSKAVFGMEHTGLYINHLLTTLKKTRANIVIEDALHIRNSLGKMRGKYDKLHALRIATYLNKSRDDLSLWEQRRPEVDQLAHLSTLRFRLVELIKAMQAPLKEQEAFMNAAFHLQQRALCADSVTALKSDLIKTEQAIMAVIKGDKLLNRLFEIITSVPCVGPITAVQIMITTNEYKDITNPKKYASYAGVAPFRKESGKLIGKARVSAMANKRVKALLHICALSAISRDVELRKFYLRKTTEEGKPKMSVINAVRFKLLLRIFACLQQDRCYDKRTQEH